MKGLFMFKKIKTMVILAIGIAIGYGVTISLVGCQDRFNFNPMNGPATAEVTSENESEAPPVNTDN